MLHWVLIVNPSASFNVMNLSELVIIPPKQRELMPKKYSWAQIFHGRPNSAPESHKNVYEWLNHCIYFKSWFWLVTSLFTQSISHWINWLNDSVIQRLINFYAIWGLVYTVLIHFQLVIYSKRFGLAAYNNGT